MQQTDDMKCIRFRPSKVEGLPDVTEVAVYPDHLDVCTQSHWQRFDFATIARPQQPLLIRIIERLLGCETYHLVADRDWFHQPNDRFFVFYTSPQLKICMPDDEAEEYQGSCFLRIREMIESGGFASYDLG